MEVPREVRSLAQKAGVAISEHKVIYHLIDDLKERISAQLPLKDEEELLGMLQPFIFLFNLVHTQYINLLIYYQNIHLHLFIYSILFYLHLKGAGQGQTKIHYGIIHIHVCIRIFLEPITCV